MTVIIKHKRVIWETSEFVATIPDGVDAHDYVKENIDELTEKARAANRLGFSTGDQSNTIEVEDEQGNEL